MTRIVADFEVLMRQASSTAREYMLSAKYDIDKAFGDGFAAKHPELVAGYMQAASIDMGAATIAKVIGEAIEELASVSGRATD